MEKKPALSMPIGSWFIANIIGHGIYEMIENGTNHCGYLYAIVECKKLFERGLSSRGHQTTCHPILPAQWSKYKIVKTPNKN